MARGGTGPYRFAIVRGTLPDGLTLDGTSGQISGRARRAGSELITLQVTDADGDASDVESASTSARAPTRPQMPSWPACKPVKSRR